MNVKIERLNNLFIKELSEIIMLKVKNPILKNVNITSVSITNDLSYAKVYFTCLLDDKKEEILKSLNKASSFVRKELCNRVEIRKMPEITFLYDESIEYGNNIENIIKRINGESNE